MRKTVKIPLITLGVLLLCFGAFTAWMGYAMRDLAPAETSQLSDNLFVIKGDMANMYLLKTGNRYVAFDASSGIKKLQAAFMALAINPAHVTSVFLTHSDGDHVGGLPLFTNATVYLSKDEVPLLQESKHRHFMGLPHKNRMSAATYKTVADNDTLMIGDLGITALATPGHTRGSMCYKVNQCIFTGDLCLIKNDSIAPMLGIFTEDMTMDSASIRKIATFDDIKTICTAHTGCCNSAKEALSGWR